MIDEFNEGLDLDGIEDDAKVARGRPTKDGSQKKGKRPPAYAHLTDAQYNRAILREQIIQRSQSDARGLVTWLHEHEEEIRRADFCDSAKYEIRRAIEYRTGISMMSSEEMVFLTSLFAPHVRAVPTKERTQYATKMHYFDMNDAYRTMTSHDYITYMTDCTYHVFWDWINSDTVHEIMRSGFSQDDMAWLAERIEHAIERNHNLSDHRRSYEEGDREKIFAILAECGYKGMQTSDEVD